MLDDPEAMGSCVPGMQEVEVFDGGLSFGGKARLKLGATSISFPARVSWLERTLPDGGRLRASATLMGYEIEGETAVWLKRDGGGGTIFSWQVDVAIPEQLASSAILLQVAHTLAARFVEDFFRCVKARLESV